MTDIPIIFSAPMVRALLDGRKTMTRRLAWGDETKGGPVKIRVRQSPWQKVKPGDRLWVREACAYINNEEFAEPNYWEYRADTDGKCFPGEWPEEERKNPDRPRWRPAIHCPREASRITLLVTATKIERLHKITEADVLAEGVSKKAIHRHAEWFDPRDCPGIEFGLLWDSLHGQGEWDKNPEVVALTFTVHKQNIDALAREAA